MVPNGKFIALVTFRETPRKYTLLTIRADGTGQQTVVEDTAALASPRWSPGGDALYYVQSGSELRRIRIAEQTGVSLDSPRTLQSGLQTFNNSNQAGLAGLSVTADGSRLAYVRGATHANLWKVTTGATPSRQQLTTGTRAKSGAAVSPDGKWVAFVQAGTGGADLFKMPLAGGEPQQLTTDGKALLGLAGSNSVAWSPDGSHIAFGITAEGPRVARISDNGGVIQVYHDTRLSSAAANLAWTPGAQILYQREGHRDFGVLHPETGQERPLLSNDTMGFVFSAQYLPDGDRVGLWWSLPSPGRSSVWVVGLRSSYRRLASTSQGQDWPFAWAPDGRSFYTTSRLGTEPAIRVIPLDGGPPRVIASLPLRSTCALVRSSGAPSFICMVPDNFADVWIIDHFDPDIRSN
jgi:Tol biopolymer transport system component